MIPTCTCRKYWYTHYILHHGIVHNTCGEQFSSVQHPPWSWPAVSCPFLSVQFGLQQCGHPSQPTDHNWQTQQPVGTCMNMGTRHHTHIMLQVLPITLCSDAHKTQLFSNLLCYLDIIYRCVEGITCNHTAWDIYMWKWTTLNHTLVRTDAHLRSHASDKRDILGFIQSSFIPIPSLERGGLDINRR